MSFKLQAIALGAGCRLKDAQFEQHKAGKTTGTLLVFVSMFLQVSRQHEHVEGDHIVVGVDFHLGVCPFSEQACEYTSMLKARLPKAAHLIWSFECTHPAALMVTTRLRY